MAAATTCSPAGPATTCSRARIGNDTLVGGPGSDLFSFTVLTYVPPTQDENNARGQDVILDFTKGVDLFRYSALGRGGIFNVVVSGEGLFDFLDNNNTGFLDNADAFVDVQNVAVGGVTRLSTVINLNAVIGQPGQNDLVTFHGVTGLTADNFI